MYINWDSNADSANPLLSQGVTAKCGEDSILEAEANKLLADSPPGISESYPEPWKHSQNETEFDRLSAAHVGTLPLALIPIAAMLPSYDPSWRRLEAEATMCERPGSETPDHYGELREMLIKAKEEGREHGSGFSVQRRNYPSERCRWTGCPEVLYGAKNPRGSGRPRKYCGTHKKDAKARTERLRYHGIYVGTHRNLSYRDSPERCSITRPDEARWKKGKPRAHKAGGSCTDQYQQSRAVWEEANTPGR